MKHTSSKDKAFAFAEKLAQVNGIDYRVVEFENGGYAAGTMKQITFHYPDALGWNFRHIW